MRCALLLAAAGCAVPETTVAPPPPTANEVALQRIAEGDSLSGIADRLSFPGGWRALAKFNGIAGDFIRASAGVRVPVDYLRAAGIDPYTEMGLEPYQPPLERRSLVPCRVADEQHGESVQLGDVTAAIELGPPRDPSITYGLDEADGMVELPDQPRRDLVIERGGVRTVIALPNYEFHLDGGELAGYRVDLDGDRRDEVVVVAPVALHNHQDFRYYRAFVIGAGITQLDVAHWGAGSLIDGDPGRCDILATSWDDLAHPLDGNGTYFVGRPLRYERGELVPRGDEVVRRFRTYFHGDDDERPAEWLGDPHAEWWHELGPEFHVYDHHDATITGVHPVGGGLVVTVELVTGARITLDPNAGIDDPEGHRLQHIGWAATSTLFPDAYVPADPARWIGAHAIVTDEDYADRDPGEHFDYHTLWVSL
jgi:hypothetical protein